MNDGSNFIPNEYNCDKVNWLEVKFTLKSRLVSLVKKVCTQMHVIGQNRLRVDGHKDSNCDMYSGSSGVLLALFKYVKMLKWEMMRYYEGGDSNSAELVKKEAQATEIELMQAIQHNMKTLSSKK